jgi:hypothetical protein
MATRKWVPIVVGVAIFVVLVGAGLIGGLVYVVTRTVKVQALPAAEGQAEFERMAAAWAGQRPFIELPAPGSDAEPIVHREMETHQTGSISTVHIRVWSPRERKLARVDLPFWLIRLGGNKPMAINAGWEHEMTLRVTPEEVDRRGPGLLVLATTSREGRLLVWTE